MGIALALAFAFVLSLVNAFGIMGLIAHSANPRTTMIVFVGSFTLTFGIGATVTGFVFMMMEGVLIRAWGPLRLRLGRARTTRGLRSRWSIRNASLGSTA